MSETKAPLSPATYFLGNKETYFIFLQLLYEVQWDVDQNSRAYQLTMLSITLGAHKYGKK